MKLEQLVTNPELSQQLVKAGIVLNTYFNWIEVDCEWMAIHFEREVDDDQEIVPAPTAEELWRYIEDEITHTTTMIAESMGDVSVCLHSDNFMCYRDKNIASALAKLILKLCPECNPQKSKCCNVLVRVSHGCDSDSGHLGKPCDCGSGVTSWFVCTGCEKACEVKVEGYCTCPVISNGIIYVDDPKKKHPIHIRCGKIIP